MQPSIRVRYNGAKEVSAGRICARPTTPVWLNRQSSGFVIRRFGVRAPTPAPRKGGRAVQCSGLENRRRCDVARGFESHPFRQICHNIWVLRSQVAHAFWGREVAGSNPAAQTIFRGRSSKGELRLCTAKMRVRFSPSPPHDTQPQLVLCNVSGYNPPHDQDIRPQRP